MTLTVGSLCSGAGALDLAVERVFGARTEWHCELEKLTDKDGKVRRNPAVDVLAEHWPGVPNHGDLTAVDWNAIEPVDLMTAGYPCQPFSPAGKRKGTDDERHIWPDVREAIRRLRPRITFLENVAGHRSLGFDRVLGDLAEDGLHARWVSLRASDVGSCHARERLWIVVTDPNDARSRRGPLDLPRRQPDPAGGDLRRQREGRGAAEQSLNLLPTPSAADGGGGHLTRSGTRSSELLLPGVARAYASGDLLPTPAAADAERGPDFARAGRDGSGGDDLVTICARATRNLGSNWGKYEAAIRRWEALTRSAPSPTEPNSKGNPRLNPAFSEWMMGWPAGWVTDVPGISRNDQLRIIGNGVVPQCAEAALTWLLSLEASEVVA